ncbi:hypothetical protein [Pseudonocardia sp. T1-2H]|uniref:hypothetical protein n=1 Tax=Pseudonocardia sp. T1-2H TaxID=3128899 RepID=UPI0031012AC5
MIEQSRSSQWRKLSARVLLPSLLVGSGVGVFGVAPALAAGSPTTAALHANDDGDHDRGDDGHRRIFRDRGDVRYMWFRVCDTAPSTAAASTGTTSTGTTSTTTLEPVAPDAVAAAVAGATTTDTTTGTVAPGASTSDTTTTTTTTTPDTAATETTTDTTTTDADDATKAYPTFIVIPMAKDEAKALDRSDRRECYDLTTRALTSADTTSDTETTTATPTVTETPAPTATTQTTG